MEETARTVETVQALLERGDRRRLVVVEALPAEPGAPRVSRGHRRATHVAEAIVARLVATYDLVSVPLTDRERRLLGTISVEDVIDVLGEEASSPR